MTALSVIARDDKGLRPGVTFGVPYERYAQIPAVNFSLLKHAKRSMKRLRHEMLVGTEPTEAMDFGTLFHTITFEPHKFDERYAVSPKFDRRTKDGKANASLFELTLGGRIAISQDELDIANEMGVALGAHPFIGKLIGAPGLCEAVAVARDPKTGLWLKCRVDKLAQLGRDTYVCDAKSTIDASDEGFSRSIAKLQYHQQAELYLRILNVLAPRDRTFVWLASEKTRPYECQAFQPCAGALAQAEEENDSALRQYKESLETGYWPGYSTGLMEIDLPRWAQRREEF